MDKFDWRKQYKALYFPKPGVVSVVTVPKMHYIMVDGKGDPNKSERLQDCFQALYSVAYTIKFDLKKAGREDYTVFPPEGLWYANDPSVFVKTPEDKSAWKWTIVIAQPDFITKADFENAQKTALAKKGLPLIADVRFESMDEGEVAQMMHIGPYATEGPNIQKLHDYIAHNKWALAGKHHEIYLSDPRRGNPEKMKTVIRQPFSR